MPSILVRTAVLVAALPSFFAIHETVLPHPRPMSIGRVAAVTLSGRITNAATGTPLEGVQVWVEGTSAGALSRAGGSYLLTLADAAVGQEVTVRAERIGFAGARRTLKIAAGANLLDFALEPAALGLDEIVITGAAGQNRTREETRRTDRPAPNAQPSAGPPPAPRPPVPPAGHPVPSTTPSISPATPPVVPGSSVPPGVRRAAEPFGTGKAATAGGWNAEDYERIVENPFWAARSTPLSTFAIDVDRASYANVRRFISSGTRPPADAVRIEELINYFPYAYPEPHGKTPFAVHTEVARAPWQPAHLLVKVGIQGRRIATESMPPANLTFLVDVSGSMQPENKLPLVKSSLRMLVHELRAEDRVAIVVYAGAAGLVLPPTPGSDKRAILHAIDRLEAGGSTAGGAGLELAYRLARRSHVAGGNNRVILATDGDFNVGASSDAEMVRLIEEKRDEGTFLTVLGFGTGNLKDAKMEKIADHGNGNFAYIDDLTEARKVLVSEMAGTLLTIAKDVKVQVEFNPERVAGYRLIGYENRLMPSEDFADDKKDGGELGAGHTLTALYEVVPVGVHTSTHLRDAETLRYQEPVEVASEHGDELMFVKLRYKEPDGSRSRLLTHAVADRVGRPSTDLRFAAAVAGFGMVLRDSKHAGDFGLHDVLTLARSGLGEDLDGYRAGFVEMVERARALELVAQR